MTAHEISNNIQKKGLSDSTIKYDRRKGFSQITNATKARKAEHMLTALSRRLRDSFAHGRIGLFGEYILFEDVVENRKNRTKTITGRIVLKQGDLEIWKQIIENFINDYYE